MKSDEKTYFRDPRYISMGEEDFSVKVPLIELPFVARQHILEIVPRYV